jgi:hypothetical protein
MFGAGCRIRGTAPLSAVCCLRKIAKVTIFRHLSRSGLEFVKQYVVSENATWAQPAISGNRVFVKDVSSLALWTVN